MDVTTTAATAAAAIAALAVALQDPHLDATNRAQIHTQIDGLRPVAYPAR